jgi:hypothetical protein
MNYNSILKNQTQQNNLEKKLILKKTCKTRYLGHETIINT